MSRISGGFVVGTLLLTTPHNKQNAKLFKVVWDTDPDVAPGAVKYQLLAELTADTGDGICFLATSLPAFPTFYDLPPYWECMVLGI